MVLKADPPPIILPKVPLFIMKHAHLIICSNNTCVEYLGCHRINTKVEASYKPLFCDKFHPGKPVLRI